MSKIMIVLGVLSFLAFIAIAPARAACPPPTGWQCWQGYGGKVICACR
jgi:hypothetical protein